jgi:hypothetical protein
VGAGMLKTLCGAPFIFVPIFYFIVMMIKSGGVNKKSAKKVWGLD